MKNYRGRIILIIAAVALALVFLWPTYKDYSYRKDLSSLTGEDSVRYYEQHREDILDARAKRMKLGLDLQGGMRVVLEVDVLQMLEDMAKNKDENFYAIMKELRTESSTMEFDVVPAFIQKFKDRGISLRRYYGTMRESEDRITSMLESETEKGVDRAIEIVRNRIDQYGVAEPTIQKQGGKRIIVELPGVKDEAEVTELLRGTAKLEFKLVKDPEITYKVMEAIDRYLAGKSDKDTALVGSTSTKKDTAKQQQLDALTELTGGKTVAADDTTKEAQFMREHPFFSYVIPDQQGSGDGYVAVHNKERVAKLLEREDIKRLLPPDFQFVWSNKPLRFRDGSEYYQLIAVKSTPELTGGVIVNAMQSVDPEDNRPIVNMEMNAEGAREWARITGANIKKRIAIILDNACYSAPVVQQKITGGRSRITGMDTPNEARLLEIVLKAGALPAPVTIIEKRTVGPSLGEDSIRSGFTSLALAFLFTILFMIVYYNNAGAIADFALLFNILFILGVMAAFQATLTLPGIAGIVLTIGMAVDANVLINERIREELEGGKTLRAAIDAGYSKAFTAIFDSNITTFLTGIILYNFGTGPVQGFALTLMIGIVASMFSAIVITHVIFNIMTERGFNPNFG
ncbi:MAG: protein translocase subunit SecD [Bacteroidetes bacterium]|nr:protein translocase subunit SecD [Bacteroidota bacterium]